MSLLSARLKLGYVGRAHGLRGEVAVRTFDPSSETLFDVPRVHLRLRSGDERTLEVLGCRAASRELLVQLETISNRELAESLVGATVSVLRTDLEAPGEGEYFLGDLLGLQAIDEAGHTLGEVTDIWDAGGVPNLVIQTQAGELMVPFADEFVPDVSLAQRRVVIRPPVLFES